MVQATGHIYVHAQSFIEKQIRFFDPKFGFGFLYGRLFDDFWRMFGDFWEHVGEMFGDVLEGFYYSFG